MVNQAAFKYACQLIDKHLNKEIYTSDPADMVFRVYDFLLWGMELAIEDGNKYTDTPSRAVDVVLDRARIINEGNLEDIENIISEAAEYVKGFNKHMEEIRSAYKEYKKSLSLEN